MDGKSIVYQLSEIESGIIDRKEFLEKTKEEISSEINRQIQKRNMVSSALSLAQQQRPGGEPDVFGATRKAAGKQRRKKTCWPTCGSRPDQSPRSRKILGGGSGYHSGTYTAGGKKRKYRKTNRRSKLNSKRLSKRRSNRRYNRI